jgi:hypothetical protein
MSEEEEASEATPETKKVKVSFGTEYQVQEYHDSVEGTARVQLCVEKNEPSVVGLTLTFTPAADADVSIERWEVDSWQVLIMQSPYAIWASLREYLEKYCPCPDYMWSTVEKLRIGLPETIQEAIKTPAPWD